MMKSISSIGRLFLAVAVLLLAQLSAPGTASAVNQFVGADPAHGVTKGTTITPEYLNSLGLPPTIITPVRTLTASASISADTDYILLVDATSGTVTLSLPSVSDLATGRKYVVKKTDSSTNAVVITPTGSETIDSLSSISINRQNASLVLVNSGTSYQSVNYIEQAYEDAVDALMQYGSGVNYTQATLSAALTAIGTTTRTTLTVRPGTWTITSTADWSSYANVLFDFLPGAVLNIATGVTLTMPIPENVPSQQIFNCSGTGKAVFSSSPGKIRSAWFGTTKSALQLAADSAPEGATVTFNRAPTYYSASNAININTNDDVAYEYESNFDLRMTAASTDAILITKDNIRMYGNGAKIQGYGTFYAGGSSGASLIRSEGDYTEVYDFHLIDPETAGIRFLGDYGKIARNTVEGGPFYTSDPGDRVHIGIWLVGALTGTGTGASYTDVWENTVKKNASGGKPIEAFFGGHVNNPGIGNRFWKNKVLEGAWDHCFYFVAEGSEWDHNYCYLSGGIKVHMLPYGSSGKQADRITDNTIINTGMESGPFTGDMCITLGDAAGIVVSGNICKDTQNACLYFAGTSTLRTADHIIEGVKMHNNLCDGVVDGSSTFSCGMAVNDGNLAAFRYNDISWNQFLNIGTDADGYNSGICFVNLSNTNDHVGNSFDHNTMAHLADRGLYLKYLTGGSASWNKIYDSGVVTASPAIEGLDLRNFDIEGNRAEGTGSQLTYGYKEDEATSRYNRLINNVFRNTVSGLYYPDVSVTTHVKDNTANTSKGETLSYSTAGARTITAADLMIKVHRRDPTGSSVTDTTDTAANIIAWFLPAVGAEHEITYYNISDAAETITISGGTGVTIYNSEGAGDAVIPAGSAAILKIVRTGSATVSIFVTVFEAV